MTAEINSISSGAVRSCYLDLNPKTASPKDLFCKGKPFILTSIATSQTYSSPDPRGTKIKFDLKGQLYTKNFKDLLIYISKNLGTMCVN